MKFRKLGWTDLELSVIGLGTFAVGGEGWQFSWGPQDDGETEKTIRAAIDNGVNWIDTAPAYGLGHAEEIIGRTLKGIRKKVIIATKCGRVWDAAGELSGCLKKSSVKKEAEASLKRLDTDVIDLYQIHWPQPDEQIEEGWGAIAELIKEGKIRYGGLSNFNVEQMKRAGIINDVASLQPPYSMLRRGIEREIMPYCADKRIGIIAYSPMEKGLLTGKFTAGYIKNLPDSDHRKRDSRFNGPAFEHVEVLLSRLNYLCKKHNRKMSHIALAWVLRKPEVTAAIVGARHAQQAIDNASVGDFMFDESDIREIEVLLDEYKAAVGSV
jgi:aryl-alcohol dehydrogenase-like predicted oxidoreductase